MTAAAQSLPMARMRDLERQIEALNRECGSRIMALNADYNAKIEPLEQKLELLQKTLLDPSELRAEHEALQGEYWELYQERERRGGWKEKDVADVDALFVDRTRLGAILGELGAIEEKLKVLGVETHDLETFILDPRWRPSAWPRS